ncbi:MAG: group 1 glycosyl transferase [Verrucomicrobiales bacterium]|nr:group 1 glycosyl transferase [Verrucomicrobiales bacterium]
MNVVQNSQALRVCLLIGSLEFGGAERQVIEMARSFDRRRINPVICTLSDKVPLVENDPETRRILHTISKRGRFDLSAVTRLAGFLRRRKINVVHAFLFDCEIAARLAAPLAGVQVVIASERNADYRRSRLHQCAQLVTKPLFDVMIANSHAGARFNVSTLGLDESRLRVVHNGVDTQRFKPDPAAGPAFRAKFGIGAEEPVVGMAGSFKRQKDHGTFLRMAAKVLESRPDCRFLIAGDLVSDSVDSPVYATEIRELARELKLGDRCLFIGNQLDIPGFFNACDLTALLSLREGTPNVALESMACGRPVIATDIADNSIIIRDGEVGHIVPTGDWAGAANHTLRLLGNPVELQRIGAAAREHVCREFTPARAAAKLAEIYLERYRAKCRPRQMSLQPECW